MRERPPIKIMMWMVMSVIIGFICGVELCSVSASISTIDQKAKVAGDIQHKAQLQELDIPEQGSTLSNESLKLESKLNNFSQSQQTVAGDASNQQKEQLSKHSATNTLMKSATSNDMNVVPKKNHSSWCPTAVCHNSDICYPCQRRFLLLFATGRSASTTLTHMLDLLPGVRMSGENRGTVLQIQQLMDNVRTSREFRTGAKNKKMAWSHNEVPTGAYSCVGQHMIETINPPVVTVDGSLIEDDRETIVGFKSIRFFKNNDTWSDDEQFVAFVKEMFPCARILVNIRSNVTEQALSHKYVFGTKNENFSDEAQLVAKNERMLNLVKLFGEDYARLLDSSKWTNNIDDLNKVVEWLGFSQSCFFTKLLEFNTGGPAMGYGNGKTRMSLPPDCKPLG